MNKIDISKEAAIGCNALYQYIINQILDNHGIAEVKKERDGIAVVEISRKLRTSK